MTTTAWVRGQRWVSESEAELGLGIILRGGAGRVEIVFPAAGETRLYALESAPLRRVKFLPGDEIITHEGTRLIVDSVREEAGLLVYHTATAVVPEAELSDSISFSKPEERIFGGKLDDPADFDLRGEALSWRAAIRRSPVRGLAGARMDLIPHQLFIADEVASRPRPRVLLADEVGLGKTIEACLILHRLLLTGRISRVLILVPEPLVHQWFVELLRRFHLTFDIFNEERCEAVEYGDPDANPFLEAQLILSAVDFLADNPQRAEQARAAGWDMLVVDEAHHLEWTPEHSSATYEVVRALAHETEGLLLLTATPQQLGEEGHFARLHLLDPERHADLTEHRHETAGYEMAADLIDSLDREIADPRLAEFVAGRPRLEASLAAVEAGQPGAGAKLVGELLDSFGLGRVMFRNTRARLGGFPRREPELTLLTGKDGLQAKLKWLSSLLAELPESEKMLVIVKTLELAAEVVEGLKSLTGIDATVFHEELSLIQRDRNAAFFAEEDGARVLVCSEIGSEGRNFQFARHLVLLDLPEHVDLLEQRIGRLDRIGQRGAIRIHVPYLAGKEEVRVRWLHEGLDAFRTTPAGAAEIQSEVEENLDSALAKPTKKNVETLLAHTAECRARIAERLARGQDRLLERSSHRPERSSWLVAAIREQDADAGFEDFVIRMFDHAGLHVEDLGARRYFLLPGNLKSDTFPSLPGEGLTVTLDRTRAVEREHEAFLTRDHPMVRGALDLLLGSEAGNASFGLWDSAGEKRLLLESWVIVECVAPASLHVERFLPQTPFRIAVDHSANDLTAQEALLAAKLRRGDPGSLLRNESVKRKVLPAMLAKVRELAMERSVPLIKEALGAMERELSGEIDRLKDLATLNDHVRPEEIAALEARRQHLSKAISNARVRVDAVRLIWMAPPVAR
jgi:ATP-dependent helicase HepA